MLNEYKKDSNWIWSPSWSAKDKTTPCLMLFRKVINLGAEPKAGMIQISADTRYKLYINDELVEVGPSRGDYQVWFYDTIELVSYLKKGKNVLSVCVLRYPQEPTAGNHGMFRTLIPGLYITGHIKDREDICYDISSDSSWKCKKDNYTSFYQEEERFAPLVIHEISRGNQEIFHWKKAEYNDSDWESAKAYIKKAVPMSVSPGNLKPRNIPYMYRKKRQLQEVMDIKKSVYSKEDWISFLKNEKKLVFAAHTEEVIELDAGEEMTGYIRAAFLGGKGAKITLLYSEAYVQKGVIGPEEIPIKADRIDKEQGHLHGYKDYYEVGGFGEEFPEIYEPYWFRTFRFIRLHIKVKEEAITLCELNYEETGYPLDIVTSVTTSDNSLKDIWEISKRTLQRCMHETYEDCPFYEQLQYIMDARTQILYTYAVSADDRLARKCMDDLRRSQRYDGLLNCSYPNCNANVIPGFSIYYILMLYDHMMYFGDKKLIISHMPVIEQILQFFDRHLTEEGYVEKIGGINMEARFWSFIDWAREWNDTSGMPTAGLKGALTMESLLYLYGLQHTAKLMDFLNRKEEQKELQIRANNIQKALLTYCIGKNGMLQDGPGIEEYSQHCQVFAILTDTIDMETGKKNLLTTIHETGYTQCTVAMRFYLFRALEKTGLYQYTDQYWNTWRKMIANHCTTCVESEVYPRSECHGWGALALYELPSVILGVRPAQPGYKKVKIAPVQGYLTSASGHVTTPIGEIDVSWKIENKELKIKYKVPEGAEVV